MSNEKGDSAQFWPSHIERARDPENWLRKSYHFKFAAEVLYDAYSKAQRFDLRSLSGVDTRTSVELAEWQKGLSSLMPCIVCLGYSMELMFKALIVQKDPAAAIGNDKIHMDTSHSFFRLADQAGVKLSNDEDTLLKRLSDYLGWGRYPTKKDPSKYRCFWEDEGDFHPDLNFQLSDFYIPNLKILDRISSIYSDTRQDLKDS